MFTQFSRLVLATCAFFVLLPAQVAAQSLDAKINYQVEQETGSITLVPQPNNANQFIGEYIPEHGGWRMKWNLVSDRDASDGKVSLNGLLLFKNLGNTTLEHSASAVLVISNAIANPKMGGIGVIRLIANEDGGQLNAAPVAPLDPAVVGQADQEDRHVLWWKPFNMSITGAGTSMLNYTFGLPIPSLSTDAVLATIGLRVAKLKLTSGDEAEYGLNMTILGTAVIAPDPTPTPPANPGNEQKVDSPLDSLPPFASDGDLDVNNPTDGDGIGMGDDNKSVDEPGNAVVEPIASPAPALLPPAPSESGSIVGSSKIALFSESRKNLKEAKQLGKNSVIEVTTTAAAQIRVGFDTPQGRCTLSELTLPGAASAQIKVTRRGISRFASSAIELFAEPVGSSSDLQLTSTVSPTYLRAKLKRLAKPASRAQAKRAKRANPCKLLTVR